MSFCDFHLHTTFSDGKKVIHEVFDICTHADVQFISITDHDDIRSASIIPKEIQTVSGIELSSHYGNAEIHLLGYGYDVDNIQLTQAIERIRVERQARMIRMLTRAVHLKFLPDIDFSQEIHSDKVPGRSAMADLLIRHGAAKSRDEVFSRFLGERKVLYEPVFTLDVFEALDILLQAGCITSFAHPQRSNKDEIIKKLVSRGLHALEAYYPFHDEKITHYYLNLAAKYSMMVTGGSDYHSGVYAFSCQEDNLESFIGHVRDRIDLRSRK